LRLLRHCLILLMSLVSLLPFYALLIKATGSPGLDTGTSLNLLPGLYFGNLMEAWRYSAMGRSILNSAIITTGGITLVVLASSSAGYAIARFSNRFHRLVFNTFLFCMMIPPIIITVPLYILMRTIAGINSHWAMILVCGANAIPFSVFLYTSFIKSISREIEESAIVDGCTWFSAFWRITFPLLQPITAAVVIINGLGIWNNYAQAVFFLQSQSMRTIPLAISMFFQQYGAKWNLMAAAAMIGMAPAIVTFLVFQKYFIKGLAQGAVKG